MCLFLKPSAWSTDEPSPEHVIQFDVVGLPPGQEAWIGRMRFGWQILRQAGARDGEWFGSFELADTALAWLEEVLQMEALLESGRR